MELVDRSLGLAERVDEVEEALYERASVDNFFSDLSWMGAGLGRRWIFVNAAIGFGSHILLDSLVSRVNRVRSQDVGSVDFRMLVCMCQLISVIDELVLRELVHQGFGLEDPGKLSKKIIKHLLAGAIFASFCNPSLSGRAVVFKDISPLLFGCALVFLRSCTGNQIAPTVLYVLNVAKNIKELRALKKV